MKGALVIAHGSRAKETEAAMDAVVSAVRAKTPETLIECVFMEFSDRTVESGLSALAAQGVTEIQVIPYFLFSGIHMQEDVPRQIRENAARYPGLSVTIGTPIGADPRLAEILADRIKG